MESNNEYALITGASLGIGREIAKEFARRKINTLLIALDTPDLYDIQKDLQDNYDIRAECFPVDLTDYTLCGCHLQLVSGEPFCCKIPDQ